VNIFTPIKPIQSPIQIPLSPTSPHFTLIIFSFPPHLKIHFNSFFSIYSRPFNLHLIHPPHFGSIKIISSHFSTEFTLQPHHHLPFHIPPRWVKIGLKSGHPFPPLGFHPIQPLLPFIHFQFNQPLLFGWISRPVGDGLVEFFDPFPSFATPSHPRRCQIFYSRFFFSFALFSHFPPFLLHKIVPNQFIFGLFTHFWPFSIGHFSPPSTNILSSFCYSNEGAFFLSPS